MIEANVKAILIRVNKSTVPILWKILLNKKLDIYSLLFAVFKPHQISLDIPQCFIRYVEATGTNILIKSARMAATVSKN